MEDPRDQAIRQIYCENCDAFEALVVSEPITVLGSAVEYYNLICGSCSRVIATVPVSASKPNIHFS
jgi:hypothetical protein